jgi:hypothetical protein
MALSLLAGYFGHTLVALIGVGTSTGLLTLVPGLVRRCAQKAFLIASIGTINACFLGVLLGSALLPLAVWALSPLKTNPWSVALTLLYYGVFYGIRVPQRMGVWVADFEGLLERKLR